MSRRHAKGRCATITPSSQPPGPRPGRAVWPITRRGWASVPQAEFLYVGHRPHRRGTPRPGRLPAPGNRGRPLSERVPARLEWGRQSRPAPSRLSILWPELSSGLPGVRCISRAAPGRGLDHYRSNARSGVWSGATGPTCLPCEDVVNQPHKAGALWRRTSCHTSPFQNGSPSPAAISRCHGSAGCGKGAIRRRPTMSHRYRPG